MEEMKETLSAYQRRNKELEAQVRGGGPWGVEGPGQLRWGPPKLGGAPQGSKCAGVALRPPDESPRRTRPLQVERLRALFQREAALRATTKVRLHLAACLQRVLKRALRVGGGRRTQREPGRGEGAAGQVHAAQAEQRVRMGKLGSATVIGSPPRQELVGWLWGRGGEAPGVVTGVGACEVLRGLESGGWLQQGGPCGGRARAPGDGAVCLGQARPGLGALTGRVHAGWGASQRASRRP
jgi:hypothetical protein